MQDASCVLPNTRYFLSYPKTTYRNQSESYPNQSNWQVKFIKQYILSRVCKFTRLKNIKYSAQRYWGFNVKKKKGQNLYIIYSYVYFHRGNITNTNIGHITILINAKITFTRNIQRFSSMTTDSTLLCLHRYSILITMSAALPAVCALLFAHIRGDDGTFEGNIAGINIKINTVLDDNNIKYFIIHASSVVKYMLS